MLSADFGIGASAGNWARAMNLREDKWSVDEPLVVVKFSVCAI
jgi:hypothetical protein